VPQTRQTEERRQAAIERVARVAAQHREVLEGRLCRLRARAYGSEPLVATSGITSGGNENSAKGEAPAYNSSRSAVTIFDWDDTLFPTWFIENVVVPCTPSTDEKSREKYHRIQEDSPFFEVLQEHARVIQHTLEFASSIARVVIVTNARSPWVKTSSAMYLPGLDLDKLLDKCKIRVYYAREAMPGAFQRQARIEAHDGVNPFVVAKRCAMAKCLRKLYHDMPKVRWNVICIGDSLNEQEAIKDYIWCNETAGRVTLCKTVKFMDDPNAKQVVNQLQVVSAFLDKIINHSTDLDLSMEDWETSKLQTISDMDADQVDLRPHKERLALGRIPGSWVSDPFDQDRRVPRETY
jgi:hypothetical protein